MRLISARVRGIGRLVDTKVNLDAKVIAVVGPNEAGKSTLLGALEYLNSGSEIPAAARSRAVEVSDETETIRAAFVLDEDDVRALADLDLRDEPRRVEFTRRAGGGNTITTITPRPVKSPRLLQEVLPALMGVLLGDAWQEWLAPDTAHGDLGADAPRHFGLELKAVIGEVEALIADTTREPEIDLQQVSERLASVVDADGMEGAALRDALSTVAHWVQRDEPEREARKRLWSRSPDFVLFGEEDRALRSTYTIDDALVNDPPLALRNLAGAAQLDLGDVLRSFGDLSRRATAVRRANRTLEAIFGEAWKQSQLTVYFEVDGKQLRVHLLENSESVTIFDERSAGLRMFVALTAFLKVHGSSRPPILLIDEAESHLHLDAQADLVNMFVLQESAAKVIYTTHSPGCLPPDLGTGIRAVVPRSDSHQISDVRNSFWHSGPGFSPLMVAMGAAAAAFTPARRAVLTEGATEMILLPTLIRRATGLAEMPYQVAPGLSEAPARVLPALDLEAARVAYLVDGDAGGRELAESLIGSGVPEKAICELGVPGVENLLDPAVYRDAFVGMLPECNPNISNFPSWPSISLGMRQAPWATFLEDWAKQKRLHSPSKIAVANRLVESGAAQLSPAGEQIISELHARFLEVLFPDGDS